VHHGIGLQALLVPFLFWRQSTPRRRAQPSAPPFEAVAAGKRVILRAREVQRALPFFYQPVAERNAYFHQTPSNGMVRGRSPLLMSSSPLSPFFPLLSSSCSLGPERAIAGRGVLFSPPRRANPEELIQKVRFCYRFLLYQP